MAFRARPKGADTKGIVSSLLSALSGKEGGREGEAPEKISEGVLIVKVNIEIVLPATEPLKMFSTSKSAPAVLSDEHTQSSYGLPVVLINERAHGPADLGCLYPGYQVVVVAQYTDTEPVERLTTAAQRKMIDSAAEAGYRVYKY